MSREILKLMTDEDLLEGMTLKLRNDGFNEKTIADLLTGARKIMDACTRSELCAVVFAENPEKCIRPFIDAIFPYMSFNKVGWYGVALRILGRCVREIAANELTEDDIAALARLTTEDGEFDDEYIEEFDDDLGDNYFLSTGKDKASIAAKKAARRLQLPFPSVEDARRTLDRLSEDEDIVAKNKLITDTITNAGKENRNVNAVYRKVELISAMCGPADIDRAAIARQIVSCNIDNRLTEGDEDAVTVLAWTLHDDNHKDLYMFSVRYCAMHNPNKFPFFNAATVRALKYCRDNHGFYDFANDELLNYPKYKTLLAIFREKYELKGLSLSEISWLLTYSGKLLAGK